MASRAEKRRRKRNRAKPCVGAAVAPAGQVAARRVVGVEREQVDLRPLARLDRERARIEAAEGLRAEGVAEADLPRRVAAEVDGVGEVLGFSVGHKRVAGRDAVKFLYDRGALTGRFGRDARRSPSEWMQASVRMIALLRYGELKEASTLALGSALAADKVMTAGSGGKGGTSDPYVWAWVKSGKVSRLVGEVERAVLAAWPGGLELNALRAIAGLNHGPRALARGGRQAEAVTEALIRAADVVARVLRTSGCEMVGHDWKPRVGKAVERAVEALGALARGGD